MLLLARSVRRRNMPGRARPPLARTRPARPPGLAQLSGGHHRQFGRMAVAAQASHSGAQIERAERNRALLRWWLYVVLAFLLAIFLVGGATRLTGSGLSITEWQPIHGVVPPVSDAEWQEEFA